MSRITVLGRDTSSNVQTVMWCAAELGLEVERRDLGGPFGGVDTPEYLALNPNGLVPTVLIESEPIWESMAVVRCLAAMHGAECFHPRGPLTRAKLDMWAEWGKVTFAACFAARVFIPLVRQTAAQRDEEALAKGVAELARLVAILDAHLAASPFMGKEFSFSDIPAGTLMFRLHSLEETGELTLPPHANLTRWYEALKARPAYARHVMISFDSLRAK